MAFLPFTGEDDNTDNPIQSIVGGARNVGQGINDTLFRDPESRSALLQIGLGLMQPMAQGQTTLGHIGQAVGSGGEALHRIQEEDVKQQKADDAMTISQQRMELAELRRKDPNTLTAYEKARLAQIDQAQTYTQSRERRGDKKEARQAQRQEEDKIDELAGIKFKASRAIAADENDPEVVQNSKKTYEQIRQEIATGRASRLGPVEPDDTEAAPAGKPKTVRQNGVTYTLGADGKYH